MSRVMRDGQTAAFRAVITTTHEDGEESVDYAGPYATKGAASAAITRAKTRAEWYTRWEQTAVTGHVETSSITWTKVEK
jgi:hypothetical protein